MQHLSRLRGKRQLSMQSLKRAIQYSILGLKDENQLQQEYGINRKLRKHLRLWYWQHYQDPKNFESKTSFMKKQNSKKQYPSKQQALEAEIAALKREKAELEKQLSWAELKNATYEKLIEITERDLGIPLRKKAGAKPSKK